MSSSALTRGMCGIFLFILLPVCMSGQSHGPRLISVQGNELSEHRLTAPVVIHEQLPEGYTSIQVFLHVVVNTSGHVERATAWNLMQPETWARSEAESVETAQQFKPFTRWHAAVRARFDDWVWIVPPVQWAPHVPFPEINNWETLRIRLNRTYCYGVCPVYSVEVRGNGQVLFDGEENVPILGHHSSRISREAVIGLLAAFRDADFFSLKDEYAALITDLPSCTTSIEFDGYKKSVKDYVGFAAGMPEVVVPLERRVDQIARSEGWFR